MSALQARLDAIIEEFRLLKHPFYQEWNEGTLPEEKLTTYAREYGAFIKTIADGWAAHGDHEIAEEEQEHAEIWNRFAGALGTEISEAKIPQVKALVEAANQAFSDPVTSLGGLYAFEAQQPGTSKSKLKGLKKHYGLPETAHEYFVIHEHDDAEPALLVQRMEALGESDQLRAEAACREVCERLWDALSGVHQA